VRTKRRDDRIVTKELNVETKLEIAGVEVTATAAELNALDGITASVAELNLIDGSIAGTAVASKAAVLGANKNLDTLVIADGGLKLGSGAGTAVSSTANELNTVDGAPLGTTTLFTIGAEAGDVINVAVQLKDANGADLAVRGSVEAYLSDDANGDSIVGTAPDGGWAIGTDGVLIPIVAGKYARLVSESDGDIDINITHAGGAKTVYLILILPNGKLVASGAITFAA
jgi:hypothetical protein